MEETRGSKESSDKSLTAEPDQDSCAAEKPFIKMAAAVKLFDEC